MQISEHFNLSEVLATQQAGFAAMQVASFGAKEAINACRLAHMVLEPWRRALGVPIKINSWYRCPGLNAQVGGSKTSQHVTAEAADCVPRGVDLREAYIQLAGLPLGQRILYIGGDGKPDRIHVSVVSHTGRAMTRDLVKVGSDYLPFAQSKWA